MGLHKSKETTEKEKLQELGRHCFGFHKSKLYFLEYDCVANRPINDTQQYIAFSNRDRPGMNSSLSLLKLLALFLRFRQDEISSMSNRQG